MATQTKAGGTRRVRVRSLPSTEGEVLGVRADEVQVELPPIGPDGEQMIWGGGTRGWITATDFRLERVLHHLRASLLEALKQRKS